MSTVRIFNQNFRKPYLYLAGIEGFGFLLAFYLALQTRPRLPGTFIHGDSPLAPLLFSIILVISMGALGLYHSRSREELTDIIIRAAFAIAAGGIVTAIVSYVFPSLYVGRGIMLLAAGFSLLVISLSRYIFFNVVGEELLKRRVLVLGSADRANNILARLRRKVDRRGFNIVGFVPMKGEKSHVDEKYLIELNQSLLEFSQENEIDEIVVAISDRRKSLPTDDLLDCRLSGIDVVDVVEFFEREVGKIEVDLLHPSGMIFCSGFERNIVKQFSERFLDLFASALLLLIAAPIMLATVVAIRIEDGEKSSIIYKQGRVGYKGKVFKVLKFRSMVEDAEKEGIAQWAGENDPRITKVGRVIRKFRIDELPQIFNVLKGDMSFVGPRPERPQFVEELAKKIPYYQERHRVKPGITGWAQLCYPYGANDNDALQKFQYDLYYVKNGNLLLDLIILIQTVEVVIFGKGAR